jgi:hypothetical protein
MRRLAPALVLALLVGPPAASARVVSATSPYPGPELSQGPLIEDGVVSWLTTDCRSYCPRNPLDADGDGDRVEVHVQRPGRSARVVATGRTGYYDGGPNGGGTSIEFRGSATHVAIKRASFSSDEFEGDSGGSSLRPGRSMPIGSR